MGSKYTTVAVSGYNSSPPADDGTAVATNQVKWSTIKTKLPDPLKTAIEAIDTALVTFTNFGSRSATVSDSTVATDHLKTIEIASTATTGVTISLGDAATMSAGYIVSVKNLSAHSQVIGRVTGGDKINGTAQNLAIAPRSCLTLKIAATASDGYYTLDSSLQSHGSDIASNGAVNLDTATGDCVDVTGTTTITSITLADGVERTVRFTGALTLTHGSNLVLPGAASITTAAGDFAIFRGYASSVVRCVGYFKTGLSVTTALLTMNTSRILGRTTASAGAIEEITIGAGLTLSGGSLSNSSTGGVTTILASTSLPAAATYDITDIPATYAYLVLVITGASHDNGADRTIRLRLDTDNGASFDTGSVYIDGIGAAATSLNITGVDTTGPTAGAETVTSTVIISGYHGSSMKPSLQCLASHSVDGVFEGRVNWYNGTTTDAIDAIRILLSASGSFDAGTVALYGVS